jgi:hypothetical protein
MSGGGPAFTGLGMVPNVRVCDSVRGITEGAELSEVAENEDNELKRGTSFLRVLKRLRVLRDTANLSRGNASPGSHLGAAA